MSRRFEVTDPLGQPVAGALVVTPSARAQTDPAGIAEFAMLEDEVGQLVSVFADGFDYMSVVMADCDQVLIPLYPELTYPSLQVLRGC